MPCLVKRRHGICASYGIYYFTTQPHVLTTTFATDVTNIKYAYAFCLTGCVGMVKSWLESGDNTDTPLQMAELTYHLIMNALKDIKRLPSTTL